MTEDQAQRLPPPLPEEALKAVFPPREYLAKDADGNALRMIPAWKELRRVTEGYSLSDIDRALDLEAGALRRFTSVPDPSLERMWENLAPASVIFPLYDYLGLERPPQIAEALLGDDEPKEGEIGVCTHIGTKEKKSAVPKANPSVEWKNGEYHVTLPLQDGGVVSASWRPTTTSVVRIREAGTEAWSPGFETPLNGCSFVGLKPDTEYELQLTHKNVHGEGPPVVQRLRTSAQEGG